MRISHWILLPLLFGIAALGGCNNVEIDNAATFSVQVNIDGTAHEIAAGERTGIKLDAGTHTLKIKDVTGKTLQDTTFDLREAGFINAGGTRYVTWKMLYGLQKDRATLLKEEWVEIDSADYFGDFTFIEPNQAFVESDWTLGLDNDFPASQKLLILSDFVIESKLFRETALPVTYRSMATPE